jgi:predicted lipoprotein with Yx(FWY)xxD motif
MLTTLVAVLALTGGGTVVSAAPNAHMGRAILVTATGRTLYMFGQDLRTVSTCTDDAQYHCSKHWPPLLTTGAPVAKGGVKQALLGTLKRSDGTLQVTYKGHALYTWKGGYGTAGDKKPGDVKGQLFISQWFVLSPSGAVIRTSPH